MFRKSQTATEYIIILAMVIIISLIVVSTLGGLPSFGESNRARVSAAFWQNADIAIVSYAMSANNEHTLIVQNRLRNHIQIIDLNLSSTGYGEADFRFNSDPITLGPGSRREIKVDASDFNICPSSGAPFTSNVRIKYQVTEIGASYIFTGQGNLLEGTCAN